MDIKIFAPMILLLASTFARAASAPLRLPTVNGYAVELPGTAILPMTMPGLIHGMAEISVPSLQAQSYPVSGRVSLPVRRAPVEGRAILPGVPSPLPVPLPVVFALAVARRPAPSAEGFTVDFSRLDDENGDAAAPALVPAGPEPKPLAPAGALNELRDASQGRVPVRVNAEKAFDGRRETSREIALPHDRFF